MKAEVLEWRLRAWVLPSQAYGCNQQVVFIVDLKLNGGETARVKETEKVGQPEGQAGRVVREREGGTGDFKTKGLDPGGTRLSTATQQIKEARSQGPG